MLIFYVFNVHVSWHLCQPLHFSLGGRLAGHQYSKGTLKTPITFVHWWAVAMATALLSTGLGHTHNRSRDRMQMAAPRATISPSLVTNLRQSPAILGHRRLPHLYKRAGLPCPWLTFW